MVDKSDRDWRWIMRRLTRHTLLYTEMITAPAAIRENRKRVLGFDESEKPLVLQLGWDDADELAQACRIAADFGYDEVNLNCGCPSQKVQKHNFGASLMEKPDQVARIVEAMRKASSLPVTVKCRIGIESKKTGIHRTSYEDLYSFVKIVSSTGCAKFIVHARIALLDGLSPRENREIPPLRHHDVYTLKEDFPDLFIEINGGFRDFTDVGEALGRLDGVMVGRLALDEPWIFHQADESFFGCEKSRLRRADFVEACIPYMIDRFREGVSPGLLLRPLMNIFAGKPGSRRWKRCLMNVVGSGKGNPHNFASSLEGRVLKTVREIDSEQEYS